MQNDTSDLDEDLDELRSAYKAAVEEWIAAIKQEEALASVDHSVAEVDKWEQAHFREDEIRGKVKAAKKKYEPRGIRAHSDGAGASAMYRLRADHAADHHPARVLL
jgi:hypothetical protein